MHARMPTPGLRNRSGFTTIELLLAIAIIVVLMSLSVGAIFKLINWSRYRATERTVGKVHDQLNRHLEGARKAADKMKLSQFAYELANDGTAGEGQRKERAKIIQFKLVHKWYFPMSYQEAKQNVADSAALKDLNGGLMFPDGHPVAKAIWKNLEDNLKNKTTIPGPTITQSGACLMAIYQASGGKLDDLSSAEYFDNDLDGTLELVDSFSNSLAFYRNSTAPAFYVPRSQAAYPGKTYDIDDPNGLLAANTQWLTYANPPFANKTNMETFQAQFGHDPSKPLFLPLLIVSAGNNGGPTSGAALGFGDDDDLDSYRLKLSIAGSQ